MRRATFLLAVLGSLSACGPNDKINTPFGMTLPGLSDFDTISAEDKENQKWWDNYYGHKADGANN